MADQPNEREEGFGYVGRWIDGQLGWFLPKHMTPIVRSEAAARRGVRGHAINNQYTKGQRLVLCRITIEPVLDSKGREIVYIPDGGSDD